MAERQPNPDTVAWLAETAWRLLEAEHARGRAIDTKGSWLVAGSGVVLSVVASLGPAAFEAGMGCVGEKVFAALYGLALVAIAAAIHRIVSSVIWPIVYVNIGSRELRRYRTSRFYTAEPFEVQDRTMRGLVRAVTWAHPQNERKEAALRAGARLFLVGLALIASAMATLALSQVV